MFIPSHEGATASTAQAAPSAALPSSTLPVPRERVRHLLFGTPAAVQGCIRLLHKLGYAEPNEWSRPISTGRADEVMAILTKRVEVS
ncbi:hypothetical protein [Leptolyngbya sp. BC1307]|uniref:hypothetical protein n=1 Tax=Leptolyngbya sp. BC1307 TaxID=2029589 RepID=UPI000EFDA025|nr:hypothetical protein [Leptolyngbya sp. BC1307]